MTIPPPPPTQGGDPAAPPPPPPAYEVGYARPPVHTQFKEGDGRRRPGRPKGQRNVRTVLSKALNEKTKIREGNRTRTVTKLDAMILKMIADAHTNPKVQANLIAIMKNVGLMEVADASPTEQAPLTADDDALLNNFYERKRFELEFKSRSPLQAPAPETKH